MAIRLITGRLQQRSRYCAKQQSARRSVKSSAHGRRWLTQAQLTRSESSKRHDVLGREYPGVSCRCLGEEGELACLCLVSALIIQPVLLRSVLRRFVHVTRSDNHLS